MMKRKRILTAVVTLSLIVSNLMPVLAANQNMDFLDAETTLLDTTEETEQQDKESMVTHSYEFTEEQKAQMDQEVQDYLSKINQPNLKTIIGVDERETVTKPDNRIALIISKLPDKGTAGGTAFLISGSQFFATAAHCIYDKETQSYAEWIAVLPGATNGVSPVGTYYVSSFGFNDNYLFANKLDAKSLDYGLIKVEEPTPLTNKPFKFLAASDTALNYFAYYGAIIPGYPVTYKGSQAVAPKKNFTYNSKFLMYKIDTSEGQSGSPIIITDGEYVLGIHTNGINPQISDDSNFGIRITSKILDEYNYWINNY